MSAVEIFLNPFGAADAEERRSDAIADALIQYYYRSAATQPVYVVLYYDEMRKKHRAPWPIDYSDHAAALDALLPACPKAVVVDIMFSAAKHSKDKSLPSLAEEIGKYRTARCDRRNGIPVYLSVHRGTENDSAIVRLHEAGALLFDPSIGPPRGMIRDYPTKTERLFGGNKRSLALRVYCDPGLGNQDKALCTKSEPYGQATRFSLSWTGCSGGLSLPSATKAIFDGRTHSDCVNHLLSFADVVDGRATLPRDAVVMYGASVDGLDLHPTPLNSATPGVVVHAMALDNLIVDGGTPPVDKWNFPHLPILDEKRVRYLCTALFLLPVTAVFVLFLRRKHTRGAGHTAPRRMAGDERVAEHAVVSAAEELCWEIASFVLALLVCAPALLPLPIATAIKVDAAVISFGAFFPMLVASYLWFVANHVAKRIRTH